MTALVVGLLITAITIETLERFGILVGVFAAAAAGVGYFFRRLARAVRIVEALADLPEALAALTADVEALKEADEDQANDHAEVKSAFAAVEVKVDQIAALSRQNSERLTALARDLGVDYRDPHAA